MYWVTRKKLNNSLCSFKKKKKTK